MAVITEFDKAKGEFQEQFLSLFDTIAKKELTSHEKNETRKVALDIISNNIEPFCCILERNRNKEITFSEILQKVSLEKFEIAKQQHSDCIKKGMEIAIDALNEMFSIENYHTKPAKH